MLGGLLGGVVGAIAGQLGPKGDPGAAAEAAGAKKAALAEMMGLTVPELEKYYPEMYQYAGNLADQIDVEKAIELGPTAMEGVAADPRLKEAQMQTLARLAEVGEGGLTAGDMAALQQVRRGAASEAQAKQKQIMQDMQQRGQAGSGAELIARLQGAQSGADRQGAMGLDVAKNAQQRALEAMLQQGQMAGNMRTQDFGEQAKIAQAKDIVNQWNAQQAAGREQRRVADRNRALERDLRTKQQMEQDRAALENQAQMKEWERQQKMFDMDYRKRAGVAQGWESKAATDQARANAAAAAAAKQRQAQADFASGAAKGLYENWGAVKDVFTPSTSVPTSNPYDQYKEAAGYAPDETIPLSDEGWGKLKQTGDPYR